MKTSGTFQFTLLLALFFCCFTACEEGSETLSSIKETTLEGEASTLEINMSRSNWCITSILSPEGWTMRDKNDRPLYLEDLGSLDFGWGKIIRDKEDLLTIKLDDNFSKEDRGFIINLKTRTGFYTETITIHQKQSKSFYHIESIDYSLQDGDGLKEAKTRSWRITYVIKNIAPGNTTTLTFNPTYYEPIDYSFQCQDKEFNGDCISSENEYSSINMPCNIENGKILFETEKRKYTDKGMYHNNEMGVSYEVEATAWKRNYYSTDILYKRLQVSYTMVLSKPDSNTKKIINGKLIKEFPYACSPIRHQIGELQEGDY